MSPVDYFPAVKRIICSVTGAKPESVTTYKALLELTDSLDRVELLAAIEEEFHIHIPEESAYSAIYVGDIAVYLSNIGAVSYKHRLIPEGSFLQKMSVGLDASLSLPDDSSGIENINDHQAKVCDCGSVCFNLLRSGKIECSGCSTILPDLSWKNESGSMLR